eukprot:CAMPEP_0176433516 /NCGR_PEP_ID=MMETSP0127-20121128/16071_1 /TAXON_ID=938130 /ORGANISM="Platyophrya macrostoma, Strain WH" /LENGTH=97 /DNA_ID=CAMNT_0017815963 /DNA_START=60 /DNA_END=353 /DNA_ORIENTATION=+
MTERRSEAFEDGQGTFNDKGELIDIYIPRKCSHTNRILHAKDKASVQINIGLVDEATGRYNGKFLTYGFSGFLRSKGRSDAALEALLTKEKIMPFSA